MYNSDTPARAELPSSRQLLRSTVTAAACAAVLLVTVILPAEYGVDPTGVGRMLRLTEMGEIKTQLAEEAVTDAAADARQAAAAADAASPSTGTGTGTSTNAASATPGGSATPPASAAAPAAPVAPVAPAAPAPSAAPATSPAAAAPAAPAVASKARWRDEMRFTLASGQGIEIKMRMNEGARAEYAWAVDGEGAVNYDTHGDGGGRSISYEKGRGVPSDEGALVAAFSGNHGWFWRNRGRAAVDLVLRTSGDYIDIRQAP